MMVRTLHPPSNDLGSVRKLSFHELAARPPREFFLYRPSVETPGAPIVVSVHGIARNAAAHAYRLMSEAERYGLCVVAPLFTKEQFGQYQQLEDSKSGVRSDVALFDIVDAVARITQADASRLLLFGFSGGAQFAHRFAMAHPDRVCSAVLAAAGWYTFPSYTTHYPYGLDTNAGGSNLLFDIQSFTRVPFHVMVGQLDIERDASLRANARLDRNQGATRVERATRWVNAMSSLPYRERDVAPPSLLMLPKVGHNFIDAVERAALARRAFECFAHDAALVARPSAGGDEHV